MKNLLLYINVLIISVSCTNDDTQLYHNDIIKYQGCWCDTLFFNDEVFLEELSVDNYSMEHVLFNKETRIVYDYQTGELILGNENKLGWHCISPFTSETRQSYWDINRFTEFNLDLFSNIYGEHTYTRSENNTIQGYVVTDTINELFKFKKYLPQTKDSLVHKLGEYNILSGENGITYLICHPLFEKICFRNNYINDSIYSCELLIKENINIDNCLKSNFTQIREINGVVDFCNTKKLRDATNVIVYDTKTNKITVSPLKDYNYWPDISFLLGMNLDDVKLMYGSKYIYYYDENLDTKLFSYAYQTRKDGLCEIIEVVVDENGIVKRCGVKLLNIYAGKTDILHLLNNKYHLNKFENGVYYYYSDKNEYEIRYNVKGCIIAYYSL